MFIIVSILRSEETVGYEAQTISGIGERQRPHVLSVKGFYVILCFSWMDENHFIACVPSTLLKLWSESE